MSKEKVYCYNCKYKTADDWCTIYPEHRKINNGDFSYYLHFWPNVNRDCDKYELNFIKAITENINLYSYFTKGSV